MSSLCPDWIAENAMMSQNQFVYKGLSVFYKWQITFFSYQYFVFYLSSVIVKYLSDVSVLISDRP